LKKSLNSIPTIDAKHKMSVCPCTSVVAYVRKFTCSIETFTVVFK
jgi:hypothetical protein